MPYCTRFLLRMFMLLLGVYSLLRVLFLFFNWDSFAPSGAQALITALLAGIRFDLVSATILSLPIILIHLLPESYCRQPGLRRTTALLFYLIHIPFLLANAIDLSLFRFSARRMTADIFNILSLGDDFMNTTPKMVIDYWPNLILFVGLVYLMHLGYSRWVSCPKENAPSSNSRHFAFSIVIICITLVSFRGGIQYKPITVLTAAHYNQGNTTALVLNSTFTLIKTWGKDELHPVRFMEESEAARLAPAWFIPDTASTFQKKNVFIIILEGIGQEYSGKLNGTGIGYTPFLDSLMDQALVFPNAFANSKRSIEGIPAITAGIPALIDQPFITSPYAGNHINSFPLLLRNYGYSSIFMHGGTNGTMGFDSYSQVAGYDRYFGRTEYGQEKDYDGNWGIYDFPFLQRTVTAVSSLKPPFVATVFTLSSHHPYKIPDSLRTLLPSGPLPIHQSVAYTDYSVKAFFKRASLESWYTNTLFIITSDHTSEALIPYYKTRPGLYSIPVIYFSPSDTSLRGMPMRTTQQIDILPSVMDYLHYPDTFFALGHSVFRQKESGGAFSYLQGSYQLIDSGYAYVLDTSSTPLLIRIETDSLGRINLAAQDSDRTVRMESRTKAFVQQFTDALLHDGMKSKSHQP